MSPLAQPTLPDLHCGMVTKTLLALSILRLLLLHRPLQLPPATQARAPHVRTEPLKDPRSRRAVLNNLELGLGDPCWSQSPWALHGIKGGQPAACGDRQTFPQYEALYSIQRRSSTVTTQLPQRPCWPWLTWSGFQRVEILKKALNKVHNIIIMQAPFDVLNMAVGSLLSTLAPIALRSLHQEKKGRTGPEEQR